jgi:CRP-like cAMP-binding protein
MNMLETFKDWDDKVDFARGEVIFREHDPADYMYVILSGEVEISLRGEPLGAELEGGVIGEMAMAGPSGKQSLPICVWMPGQARCMLRDDLGTELMISVTDFMFRRQDSVSAGSVTNDV